MKYLKIIWDLIKEAGHWISLSFKALFGNIPAVLSWIFVGLIVYFTIGKLSAFTLAACYACILGLALSIKNYGK